RIAVELHLADLNLKLRRRVICRSRPGAGRPSKRMGLRRKGRNRDQARCACCGGLQKIATYERLLVHLDLRGKMHHDARLKPSRSRSFSKPSRSRSVTKPSRSRSLTTIQPIRLRRSAEAFTLQTQGRSGARRLQPSVNYPISCRNAASKVLMDGDTI